MGRKKKKNNIEEEETLEEKLDVEISDISLRGDIKRSVAVVILFALAIILTLSFFDFAGSFGAFINKMIAYLIGWAKYVFPLFLITYGVALLFKKEMTFYVVKLIGLGSLFLSFIGIFHWFYPQAEKLAMAKVGFGGGYLGYALSYFLERYFGSAGSMVVLFTLFFLGFILAFNFSLVNFILKLKMKNEKTGEENDLGEGVGDEESQEEIKEEFQEENSQEAEEKKEEKGEIGDNIKNIEFVNGRDQFISPDIQSDDLEESLGGDDEEESEEREYKLSKRRKSSRWILPPLEILEKSYGEADGGDIETNFSIIEKTLKDFGIDVERGGTKTGPAVTQYSFRPAVGVKIAKILSLHNDLSLALAAPIRIEAPIPGQSLIGIEIPNKDSTIVRLRNVFENPFFKKRKSNLTLAFGKDVSGDCIFEDLSKMPHLMIAGSTGTGKSVCVNTIITTLLYQNSPEDLKFIMVDPKRVELSLYNGIPHLLTDVVVENNKVVNALKWAVGEMEKRYKILQETGSRDIVSYNDKRNGGQTVRRTDPETGEIFEEELKKLPYIVIIIDELADLMVSYGKEVEEAIVRIAQMARAVGIHLIVSTQRPSVEVITGLIKANIATRVAFKVATQIDSRTILDQAGAEKLLGNGDMLFVSTNSQKPKRIQGSFVSEAEVKKVVDFIKEQDSRIKKENGNDEEEKNEITGGPQKEITDFKTEEINDDDAELVKMAKEEIARSRKASASFFQRRFRIGYARAARLLDILEEEGVIGPANGSKPREIYTGEENQGVDYKNEIEDQEKRDKWNHEA